MMEELFGDISRMILTCSSQVHFFRNSFQEKADLFFSAGAFFCFVKIVQTQRDQTLAE